MSTRKTTFFYALLIAVSSLAVGMVIASRFDLTPMSSAQTLSPPAMNSAPVTGALFIAGMVSVWADDIGVKSSRDAITMPTASDDTAISSA